MSNRSGAAKRTDQHGIGTNKHGRDEQKIAVRRFAKKVYEAKEVERKKEAARLRFEGKTPAIRIFAMRQAPNQACKKCANPRRNGSAYCQECANEYNRVT